MELEVAGSYVRTRLVGFQQYLLCLWYLCLLLLTQVDEGQDGAKVSGFKVSSRVNLNLCLSVMLNFEMQCKCNCH